MNYTEIYFLIGLIIGTGITLGEWSKVYNLPPAQKLIRQMQGEDSLMAYMVCWVLGVVAWPVVIVARLFK